MPDGKNSIYDDTLYLLRKNNHFMYIKDFDKLKHTHICRYCKTLYKTNKILKKHEENCPCKQAINNQPAYKLNFQGGNFIYFKRLF